MTDTDGDATARTTAPALLRRLATAMETYSWAIGHHLGTDRPHYEMVNDDALELIGWHPSPHHTVNLTVEGDGESWRATARGTRRGAVEFGYVSAHAADGLPPRTVGRTVPQPGTPAPAPGLKIRDLGQSIELGALTRALEEGGVTTADVLAAVLVLAQHHGQADRPYVTAVRESARLVGDLRSLLSTLDRANARHAVSYLALTFVGDRSEPVAVPAWVYDPTVPVLGRVPSGPLPDDIWHIAAAAARIGPGLRVIADPGQDEGPAPQ